MYFRWPALHILLSSFHLVQTEQLGGEAAIEKNELHMPVFRLPASSVLLCQLVAPRFLDAGQVGSLMTRQRPGQLLCPDTKQWLGGRLRRGASRPVGLVCVYRAAHTGLDLQLRHFGSWAEGGRMIRL